MKYLVYIFFMFPSFVYGQIECNKKVALSLINPKHPEYRYLERIYPTSKGLASPIEKVGEFESEYMGRCSYIFAFTPFFHSRKGAKEEFIYFEFSDCEGSLTVRVDTDNDKNFKEEFEYELGENKRSVTISQCVYDKKVEFEITINSVQAVKRKELGSVYVRPLSYLKGEVLNSKGETRNIYIKNDILGTQFRLEGMESLTDSIQIVSVLEPFVLSKKKLYFSEVDLEKLEVDIHCLEGEFEGYREGYLVNRDTLESFFFFFLSNKNLLLYFWGEWCQPCIKNMDVTLSIERMIREDNASEFVFCTFGFDSTHIERSQLFLNEVCPGAKQINLMAKELPMLALHESINYKSIINQLKVTSFPTYIFIDKGGIIGFRGSSKDTGRLIELIKQP